MSFPPVLPAGGSRYSARPRSAGGADCRIGDVCCPTGRVHAQGRGLSFPSLGTTPAGVLLLSLSLEDYAKSVLSAHERLDPFRLHEDLLYFLGLFLSDVGKVLSVRQRASRSPSGLRSFRPRPLLPPALDVPSGTFRSHETTGDHVLPRIIKTCSWPADGANIRSLVDSLST